MQLVAVEGVTEGGDLGFISKAVLAVSDGYQELVGYFGSDTSKVTE